MTTIVRPRTDADFAGLEEALISCHAKTGWPLEGVPDAKAFICEDPDSGPLEQAWVAEHEGKIVGHIAINGPNQHCPAVCLWREQNGKEQKIAVVGRLFVNPATKAKGITALLVGTVTEWRRQRGDVQLIMYCVVWSAARALMLQVLAQRYGWAQYGDAVYTSPMDGRRVPAMCYAEVLPQTDPLTVQDLAKEGRVASLSSSMSTLSSKLRIWWRDPGLWFKVACLRCGLAISRALPIIGGR